MIFHPQAADQKDQRRNSEMDFSHVRDAGFPSAVGKRISLVRSGHQREINQRANRHAHTRRSQSQRSPFGHGKPEDQTR